MRRMVSFVLTAFILCCAWHRAGADVIDKIVAVVNNEIITQREVDEVLMPAYEQYRTVYSGQELIKKLEEARQEVMERVIEEKLILGEAKKANVEVTEPEIEAKIKEMVGRFDSRKEMEKALLKQNLTLKDLRARYKEQIMSRKYVFQYVGASITVTPKEIQEYYDAHKKEFEIPEQIKMRNILIKPSPDLPPERAAEAANDALKRLREGEDFGQVAAAVSSGPGASEGGVMGYVKRGDLMPEIDKVVFAMKVGELSDVIQTPAGYHIFKIEEKGESRQLELSDVRKDIDNIIFSDKIRVKLKELLIELKKRAYIAFK